MSTPYEYSVRGKKAYLFKIKRPDTGKRTTLRLGVVSKTIAKEVGLHIDKIHSSITYQLDLPPETLDWLSRIDNELYSKFVAVGLLKERIAVQVPRLKSFLTAYCDSHYNTKTKTVSGRLDRTSTECNASATWLCTSVLTVSYLT